MMTDGDIRVDNARAGDAAALARVYVDTWRTSYAGILPDHVLLTMDASVHEIRFARWIDQQSDRLFVLAARSSSLRTGGDRIVGLASAGHARGRPATTGEIYTLYVDPDWQGLGIGRSLLRSCMARLRGAGFRQAILWVLADNPSRFFYEAAGGIRAAERVERMWNTDLREVSYVWTELGAR